MAGFLVWGAVGAFLAGLGIWALFAPKPVYFWANGEKFPVTDVRGYNRAMAWLLGIYGGVFILLGLPLLAENKAWILLSIPGVAAETIAAMAVYTGVIENRFRAKQKKPGK